MPNPGFFKLNFEFNKQDFHTTKFANVKRKNKLLKYVVIYSASKLLFHKTIEKYHKTKFRCTIFEIRNTSQI